MPETLKTFTNTALAETWDKDQEGEGIESNLLRKRCENYRNITPNGVLFLTCGVDVQDDRIEGEILGWGRDGETWSIEYFVFYGNPALPAVWQNLADKIQTPIEHECGMRMDIITTCIDSGGHYTDEVYKFCRRAWNGYSVFPVKGSSQMGKVLVSKPTRNNRFGLKLFMVATDTAKETIYSRLRIDKPGPGYCHFPAHYDDEYFKQLTSEKFVKQFDKGRTKFLWKKTSPRNEALDCRVYNLAAYTITNVNINNLETRVNARIEATIAARKKEEAVAEKAQENSIVAAKPKNTEYNLQELLASARAKGINLKNLK